MLLDGVKASRANVSSNRRVSTGGGVHAADM